MTGPTRPPTRSPGSRGQKPFGVGRAWWLLTRRTLALPGAAILLLVGLALLQTRPEDWAASWSGLASYVRTDIIVLGPVAVAFGCWEGGRSKRRHTGELLATTPRPRWRRESTAFVTVGMATTVGFLAAFAVGAALVAPAASYAGGRWWASIAVSLVAVVALAALGWLIGRVIAFRLIAPIAGIGTYVAIAFASYSGSGWTKLLPTGTGRYDGMQLRWWAAVGALCFFALIAAAFATAGAARRWWWSVFPAAVAVAVAIPLGAGDTQAWVEVDPAAQRLVCTDGGRVCVWQSHAGLLPAVAGAAQPLLATITAPEGPRYRLVELPRNGGDADLDVAEIPIWLGRQATLSGTSLRDPDFLGHMVAGAAYPSCDLPDDTGSGDTTDSGSEDASPEEDSPAASEPDPVLTQVPSAAARMITGPPRYVGPDGSIVTARVPARQPITARLLAEYRDAPVEARRTWLSAEIQAAKSCDWDAFHRLTQGIGE